ncbi:hypothetical protein EPIR_2413 [Erwinia piriflorinigrans CFBP 5888]|uniref:Uncharacterized protein n=1 Tax=Erwinia piriflorinigrans CFBP 5888 TaxID=1161919 RepID=V5Z9Z6_9GAMM|nr:hypothetical protein EPIR_2413 [Erwinia piriflorinigrans CFBP 5888]
MKTLKLASKAGEYLRNGKSQVKKQGIYYVKDKL